MNLEQIKKTIEDAAPEKEKTAMFHFLFLKYAEKYLHDDPKEICNVIGAKESMGQEILKMRAVHLLMRKHGLSL